jgi:P pilus assembly chaperone PapD
MKGLKKNIALALSVFAISGLASAASIKVFPVSIDTDNNRSTVHVVNEGNDVLTLESSVYSVASSGGTASVYPPVARLEPGQKQVFRVILPAMTEEKTQYWRLKIAELAEKEFEGAVGFGVQNQLVFEVPVFLNSRKSKAELVANGSVIENVGSRQVLITKIGEKQMFKYVMPGDRIDFVKGQRVFSGNDEVVIK